MGVISMAYFLAFIAAAPASALIAPRWGWRVVFASFSVLAVAMLVVALWKLPAVDGHGQSGFPRLLPHFRKPERLAGIVAAFLTSGGLVGFLTYAGAWLTEERGLSLDRVAAVFAISGMAAVGASPLSGWVSDRVGKRRVIVGANAVLATAFLVVARLDWGAALFAGIAAIGVAASARQAPLHALSTEIVDASVRGEYTAVRNAASQLGIAGAAAASAYAFDAVGFAGVGVVAAALTALVPVTCIWLRER
jgi:predicted MFS family arabinose efflux permease